MTVYKHNPLRPVSVTEIPPDTQPLVCTCTFRGGEVAIIELHGAADQCEAHAIVEFLWYPFRRYTVSDGDVSGGSIRPFLVLLDHCWRQGQQQPRKETQR